MAKTAYNQVEKDTESEAPLHKKPNPPPAKAPYMDNNPAPYNRVNRPDLSQPCFMIARMQEDMIGKVLAPFIIPVQGNKNLKKQLSH